MQFIYFFNYQVKLWFHYLTLIVIVYTGVVFQVLLFISLCVIYIPISQSFNILIKKCVIGMWWWKQKLSSCQSTSWNKHNHQHQCTGVSVYIEPSFDIYLPYPSVCTQCVSQWFFSLIRCWMSVFCSFLCGLQWIAYNINYLAFANGPAVAWANTGWEDRMENCIVKEAGKGSWSFTPFTWLSVRGSLSHI